MNGKSKQEIENEISQMMTKFLKEQMGEEAETVITQVVGDTIIVRFKGVLPPAERHLAKNQEGKRLMREMKEKLIILFSCRAQFVQHIGSTPYWQTDRRQLPVDLIRRPGDAFPSAPAARPRA